MKVKLTVALNAKELAQRALAQSYMVEKGYTVQDQHKMDGFIYRFGLFTITDSIAAKQRYEELNHD